LLYLGTDESAARSYANADSVPAVAENAGKAQVKAALEAGRVRLVQQRSGRS